MLELLSLSRWMLIACFAILTLAFTLGIPARIQFWARQKPFKRKENRFGYIENSSTLSKLEIFAFELENFHGKYYPVWNGYKEFMDKVELLAFRAIGTLLVVSTVANLLGY